MKNILNENELFIFDLDGVVYEGLRPIKHSIESIKRLYSLKKKIAFFTNNATQTPESYAKKLNSMTLECSPEQVLTSAVVCANSLKNSYSEHSKVFVIGETGLLCAFKSTGFNIINPEYSLDEIIENKTITCDIVVAGLDRTIIYKKLASASLLIQRGAHFYASNTDTVFPDMHGLLPGAGSLVSFLTTASGGPPRKIFGKPFPEGVLQILDLYKSPANRTVILGDRIDTDVQCGKNAHINTGLVLTGVAKIEDFNELPPASKPDYLLRDLSELF